MSRRRVSTSLPAAPVALLGDIRALIEAARQRAISAVNSELTMLYWRIGLRIHTQVLEGRRADYGEEVVPTLARDLVKEYGSSFSVKNLRRMVQFAVTFPDEAIVVSLIRQLSWTHFIALIPLKDPHQRDYYAQMASAERWSVRTLRERISSMLYERTALSKKPDETIAQELATLRDAQRMSPALVMRDPYILDFLDLRDTWQESDLETAIIREMESFLLELGAGFSFVARQRRVPMYPPCKETRLIVDDELVRIFRQLETLETEGLENYVITLAIRLQFEFAARRSEICPLEWNWINLDKRRVVWPDSKTGGISKPMSEEAYRLLSTAPRRESCPYVLPSPNDPTRHLTFGRHYYGWRRVLKAAGVPHVGTHGIRHRATTNIANSGVPTKVDMKLTGHKTVAMFMHYVHTEDQPVRDAAELVANRGLAITGASRSMEVTA